MRASTSLPLSRERRALAPHQKILALALLCIAGLSLLRGHLPSVVHDSNEDGLAMRKLSLQARMRAMRARALEDGEADHRVSVKGSEGQITVVKAARKPHQRQAPPRFKWALTADSLELEGGGEGEGDGARAGEGAGGGRGNASVWAEQYMEERSNTSARMAESLRGFQELMSAAADSGDVDTLTDVGVQMLLSTGFLLNRAMFEEYDAERKRTTLRYFVDMPARIDKDGTRDALRRAKCVQHKPNGTKWGHRTGVRTTNGTSCMVRHMFPKNILPLLPESDERWKFDTCAIVGNSGRLLTEKAGAEIDKHEVVMRINSAPVLGFEEYVGSRTNINLCNHYHVAHMAGVGGKQIKSHDREEVRFYRHTSKEHRKSKNETLVLFEATLSHAYYHLYEPLFAKRPPPLTAVLSPDFVTAMGELWALLQRKVLESDAALGRNVSIARNSNGICIAHELDNPNATCARPLSGWYAVLFALRVCKEVDVYGFSADYRKGDRMARYPYHYYDQAEGETGTHSFDLTMRLVQIVQRQFASALRIF